MNITVSTAKNINKTLAVPGDKSISHRAVMFGALAKGTTEIKGFLMGEDCLSTIDCFRKLGIEIEVEDECVRVCGKGLRGLKAPSEALYVGNSGTTIRLITGILAAQNFDTRISGDESICKRPMNRVIAPLSKMGANIESTNNGYAPLNIKGSQLKAIDYTLPVASAQVKSSVILAGLFAQGQTIVREPAPSRDHTEIMLNYFGANIKNEKGVIVSAPVEELYAKPIDVPGDISSAAFFMVAGLIVPGSEIVIKNVGINKTRTGIIDALKQMGGDISVENERNTTGEPIGDIRVRYSELKAITLEGDIIPRMIDEIPVFVVAALCAEGTTVIRDATELKVKESNRIVTMIEELGKMGAELSETEDGMIISGKQKLKGNTVYSHLDHRVAMSCAVAALIAEGTTTITEAECVNISFPDFFEVLNKAVND
ncbi:MAG: 3-phosphoshikimate 1-carboxyvinyltransferase [Firmicutes bacterium]|nr:3-phosphoshikimate 1-carboxyvinyltransferase [Bacillota bacterium]